MGEESIKETATSEEEAVNEAKTSEEAKEVETSEEEVKETANSEEEAVKETENSKKESVKETETSEEEAKKETKTADEEVIKEFIEEQLKKQKTCFIIYIATLAYLVIVGLPACLLLYGIVMLIMFVVNLLIFLKRKKFVQSIENGEAGVKEIYEYYEKAQSTGVLMLLLNFFCGGALSCILNLYELNFMAKALKKGEEILGDDYKNERIANDPNAKWNYCMYCKKNGRESSGLVRLSDGVLCRDCISIYTSMLPQRNPKAIDVKEKEVTELLRIDEAISRLSLSSNDLVERYEYLQQNNEKYSDFTPTKVLYDGCLELDENNSLFRIVTSEDTSFDSTRYGGPTGLIHPYSDVQGICYEMVYEYNSHSEDEYAFGRYEYKKINTIVLAIEDKYLTEEIFTLKKISTKLLANDKKPQIEYAEKTVNELHEIFDKPILPVRKLHI